MTPNMNGQDPKVSMLIEHAERHGLWFYCNAGNAGAIKTRWMSPEQLRESMANFRFTWEPGWELRDPSQRVLELENEIASRQKELEEVKLMIAERGPSSQSEDWTEYDAIKLGAAAMGAELTKAKIDPDERAEGSAETTAEVLSRVCLRAALRTMTMPMLKPHLMPATSAMIGTRGEGPWFARQIVAARDALSDYVQQLAGLEGGALQTLCDSLATAWVGAIRLKHPIEGIALPQQSGSVATPTRPRGR